MGFAIQKVDSSAFRSRKAIDSACIFSGYAAWKYPYARSRDRRVALSAVGSDRIVSEDSRCAYQYYSATWHPGTSIQPHPGRLD